jgi:hypothetical protein
MVVRPVDQLEIFCLVISQQIEASITGLIGQVRQDAECPASREVL